MEYGFLLAIERAVSQAFLELFVHSILYHQPQWHGGESNFEVYGNIFPLSYSMRTRIVVCSSHHFGQEAEF